jgi:hypothetical protein
MELDYSARAITVKPERKCSFQFCARSPLPDGRVDLTAVDSAQSISRFAFTPAIGAAMAKAPEEGRTGDGVAAVHGDEKILAQNRVAMEAEF